MVILEFANPWVVKVKQDEVLFSYQVRGVFL